LGSSADKLHTNSAAPGKEFEAGNRRPRPINGYRTDLSYCLKGNIGRSACSARQQDVHARKVQR